MSDFFRRYLLAGLVFQSVVIGGGYATGRELMEFFMPAGPSGGLLGMGVSMLIWSAVMAASLELARVAATYDYQSFFKVLLGPAAWLFEVAYVLLLILVLAVLGAACGEMAAQSLGWPAFSGTLLLMACVGAVVFFGNATVEKILAALAVALYIVYVVFFVWCLSAFGPQIETAFAAPVGEGWLSGGVRYAGYNMAVIPSVLFCVRHLTRRREAVISGLLSGPLAMLPGALFFVALAAFYPAIASEPIPSTFLLAQLSAPWFSALFQLTVFGTLVATGAGLLHSINERAAKAMSQRGRPLPAYARPAIALGLMGFATLASNIGIVGLIAQGYGLLTWAFIALLVVPVLTIGLWKIRQLSQPHA